jgi:hypothetical protein
MNQPILKDCRKQQELPPRRFDESMLSAALLPSVRIVRFASAEQGPEDPFSFGSRALV